MQPDAAGASVETGQGYPDLVYAALLASHPALRLVRLGCPGETTQTMMHGGICRYSAGSQLAAATAFLRAHRGHVFLVTIDIGDNDLEDCGNQPSLTQLASCIGQLPKATANVAAILASLRAAAGPGVRIAGMNYYLPALAEWRSGLLGRATAELSEVRRRVRHLLKRAYGQAGIPWPTCSGPSDTNFGDRSGAGIGSVPRNVAYLPVDVGVCAPPANQPPTPGYRVIADAILAATKLS